MAGTRRHALNAAIYADTSSGGSAAVGTATLTLITSLNEWSFDQTRKLVDVTSFGDLSEANVAGLAGASGTIKGFQDFADNVIYNLLNSTTERGLIIIPDAVNNPGTFISGKAFVFAQGGGSETGAVTRDMTFAAGPTGMAWTHP